MTEAKDPKTVARGERGIVSLTLGSFVVTVVEGPDAGASVRIDGREPGRVFVGQYPISGLRLNDQTVSRRHLALELAGPLLRVTDLDSTNGTFVGSLRVTDALLQGGERIRVGDNVLAVERGDETTLALGPAASFGRVAGDSVEMRRLYPLFKKLAASDVPVVIEGETGTGKEVLAEALHEAGARASKPFVVFDCTALPASLVEAALFGHERGAFTGAVEARKGVFEQAHGGTLFIDEIGDLEMALQPKLLRALERSEVRRIGGDRWIKTDVRILSATRRDLDREVALGRFRDDLFFRLAVTRVELPPLRRRAGDVAVLAERFATELGGPDRALDPAFVAKLEAYAWPGNVRELRNVIARYLAIGDGGEIGIARASASSLPPAPSAPSSSAFDNVLGLDLPFVRAREMIVEDFTRAYVERALEKHGGNVTRAAEASGLGRRYFQTIKAKGQPKT